ncbi:MAG: MFS transporter [Anaerolineae bacterium]|nr:MFS transporter [Anaerolineae bacterium]
MHETPLSRRRMVLITAGIMLSLFLASMESTVVSTAMPTIVGKLGGLSIYSWAFAAYMITSTTATPIYGKLSDVFGRRRVYVTATAIFLAGSLLCGLASSMEMLVAFRAVQGAGAGGLLSLAFIMVGEYVLGRTARPHTGPVQQRMGGQFHRGTAAWRLHRRQGRLAVGVLSKHRAGHHCRIDRVAFVA